MARREPKLDELDQLRWLLRELRRHGLPTILLGVNSPPGGA